MKDHYNERQVWQCDRCGTIENTDYGEVILAEYRHLKGREMCGGTMVLVATDRRTSDAAGDQK